MTSKKSATKSVAKKTEETNSYPSPIINLINDVGEINLELQEVLFKIQKGLSALRELEPCELGIKKEESNPFIGGAMLDLNNHRKSLAHTLEIAQGILAHLNQII